MLDISVSSSLYPVMCDEASLSTYHSLHSVFVLELVNKALSTFCPVLLLVLTEKVET